MTGTLYSYLNSLYLITESELFVKGKDDNSWWSWGTPETFILRVLPNIGTLVGKNVQIKKP